MADKSITSYVHHGRTVFVRSDLRGTHRDHCLCFHCEHFTPDDRSNNCPIANDTFENCVKHGIATPVFECPRFLNRPNPNL
jgi:hypothetical protein